MDRQARVQLVRSAEAYEKSTKLKGKRNGDLGQTGLQVLCAIAFSFMDLKHEVAIPSYDTLQASTKLSRQTIANCIRRLERAGFIHVLRRSGCRGGKVYRETNVYRLALEAPPLPEIADSLLSKRNSRTKELVEENWNASDMKRALDRLGNAIAERLGSS